jgi:ADP-ribosylglycohydrolase
MILFGAILGDIAGSPYEARPVKNPEITLFTPESIITDDTVMSVATAEALLTDGDYVAAYRRWGRRHPNAGYGALFQRWILNDEAGPYGSWGNGGAMRVSPVGVARSDWSAVLAEAERSAAVTHDHPDGVAAAQAVAGAVFLARQGEGPGGIRRTLEGQFAYDLSGTVASRREQHGADVSATGSVPLALVAALEAQGFEEALRLAISLGGDADTQACIAGAIAAARFGVPEALLDRARERIPEDLLTVVDRFEATFEDGPGAAS